MGKNKQRSLLPPMPQLAERSPFTLEDLILDLENHPPTKDGEAVSHQYKKTWTGKMNYPAILPNGRQIKPCSCKEPVLVEQGRIKMLWCNSCNKFHSWKP